MDTYSIFLVFDRDYGYSTIKLLTSELNNITIYNNKQYYTNQFTDELKNLLQLKGQKINEYYIQDNISCVYTTSDDLFM